MAAKKHTTHTSFSRDVIFVTARSHTTHTSWFRGRHMYGSETAHSTYFIVQVTLYVWQREGKQHILHYPGDVICMAARRYTTRTSLSRGRHMYSSEKTHNTYFIVQGTSYVWQREGTQHILHCPGDVICMAARRYTTRTSLSRGRHMYSSEKAHNTYFIVQGKSYV